jgi:O-methyltransferase involved in polyketide biosynthesis
VLVGFLPPEAEVRLLDIITKLSASGSKFATDYGSLHGQTEAVWQQAQIATDRYREHGLDLDVIRLAYLGEHTDVAACLQASGWDTSTTAPADLFAAAGLPPLKADELERLPAVDYGRPENSFCLEHRQNRFV